MLLPLILGTALLSRASAQSVPDQAQVVDQKKLNVLETVEPVATENLTTIFVPAGLTEEQALAKPFHVYDEAFYAIIGSNPTLTAIASTGVDPLFHEAVVWYPPTNEVFFVQNAGAKDSGTGLKKSNKIYKISLDQAAAVQTQQNASGQVDVVEVPSNPPVINSNGGTNYRGEIVYAGEGQGPDIPPSLFVMNPREPYNTTVLLNNYFGRQFNSLNDVAVNPNNGDLYFTDTLYGYLQDFRPVPGLPDQVYRLNPATGAVSVVADRFGHCNGLTFSPNGSYVYVADTGAANGFYGYNLSAPATIYRFTVETDGTFSNRKTFAYPSPGIPDGVHCDTNGNLYAGLGDGVHVFNPSGVLLGKIWVGATSANFAFAGKGRMVICAETNLFYATLAAEGNVVASQMPPA